MSTERRKLSLSDKVAILTRQAFCGLCQRPLGDGPVEWDHIVALGLGGADEAANLHAVHGGAGGCHDVKTNGPKTKAFAQGDKAAIAKTRRISNGALEFLAAMRRKESGKGTDAPAEKVKRKIQSRGFQKRNGALTRGREGA